MDERVKNGGPVTNNVLSSFHVDNVATSTSVALWPVPPTNCGEQNYSTHTHTKSSKYICNRIYIERSPSPTKSMRMCVLKCVVVFGYVIGTSDVASECVGPTYVDDVLANGSRFAFRPYTIHIHNTQFAWRLDAT